MRLYAQHTHENDATLHKGPICSEKLVIFRCRSILSSNAVIMFALFRNIWVNGPLIEQPD